MVEPSLTEHQAPTGADDAYWMRLAIELSREVLYLTAPNPRVACLIVKGNQLLAAGVTQQAGGPHAEVMALRQAQTRGHNVAGTTIYVTLEPCSHYGRTPPCVDALIQAQPARVVVAMPDPNPLVAGQGLGRLREAGIQVQAPLCAEQALEVNPGFVSRMTRKTPWVWLKSAVSIDGQIALANGLSQWITGPQARADGHHWRARSSVVLTGLRTVLADDPQMTVRNVETSRQPIRAVVDTRFEIPETARILNGSPTWIFTCHHDADKAQRLAERQVQTVMMPERDGRVDLAAVLQWMGHNDVNEVHVEGGASLHGALLEAGLADELLVYMAPKILGAGRGMFTIPMRQSLADQDDFRFVEQAALGDDIRLRLRHQGHWQALVHSVSQVPQT
ncbi:bifunctional diaminohydroxyphosphoribosylaminopyrimidine deaminase/5-amino-6-(5-phosphoribosylamino)uracil reductase RibD [Neopusillimonas maritima]|nr:bifunctional diaminohydroxyphosphoribosylaminopyrimidine deaminase/5-amino-6-(5-phosphoribosylamino)uracil reductase RibD [Neopusillimonas maritima]